MENYELGSLKAYMDMNKGLSTSVLREIASYCLLGHEYLLCQHIINGVVEC